MELGRQIVLFMLLAVVSAMLSVSETRSISSLEVSKTNLNVLDIFYEPVYKGYITKTHFGQKGSGTVQFIRLQMTIAVLRKSAFYTSSFRETSK